MTAAQRLLMREITQPVELALARHTRYVPAPIEAALFLTHRCNSRCAMCGNWHATTQPPEMSTEEVIAVLDQLKALNVAVVSLSAEGEITLRRDLPQILDETARRGFLFSINSNLLNLSDEVVAAIVRTRPYQVTVGFDTLDSARYAAIRGIPDGASRVFANIARLQDAGYGAIALGAVVLEHNLDDLVALARFARDKHLAGVRFTAFQPAGFGRSWTEQEVVWFRQPQYLARLEEQVARLIDMKRHGYPILNTTAYLRMIADSYRQPRFFPVHCRVPWRRIHVFSDGTVSLCQVMEEGAEVGSIRGSSLASLWRSTQATEVRASVKQQGCGGCWLSCYAETNLRFSWQGAGPSMLTAVGRIAAIRAQKGTL